MYVLSIARFSGVGIGPVFCLTSQTKPGPNMAAAVAMKVVRKESRDEKEPSMWAASWLGMVVFVGL